MSDFDDDHHDSASDFLDSTDKRNDVLSPAPSDGCSISTWQFLRLKAALNAKDVELIEMRQQQIRLMVGLFSLVSKGPCGFLSPIEFGTRCARTARKRRCDEGSSDSTARERGGNAESQVPRHRQSEK